MHRSLYGSKKGVILSWEIRPKLRYTSSLHKDSSFRNTLARYADLHFCFNDMTADSKWKSKGSRRRVNLPGGCKCPFWNIQIGRFFVCCPLRACIHCRSSSHVHLAWANYLAMQYTLLSWTETFWCIKAVQESQMTAVPWEVGSKQMRTAVADCLHTLHKDSLQGLTLLLSQGGLDLQGLLTLLLFASFPRDANCRSTKDLNRRQILEKMLVLENNWKSLCIFGRLCCCWWGRLEQRSLQG